LLVEIGAASVQSKGHGNDPAGFAKVAAKSIAMAWQPSAVNP